MKYTWIIWPETKKLLEAFAPDELRFVGGAVRDSLLGQSVEDVDAATILPPRETMARLAKNDIKAIATGIDHGTVTAITGGKSFEITTLRKDVSTDGRHAVVAYTENWREDAARRDFTINAMYLSASGELFDYFGGKEDLQNGRVRFIGDAATRIGEDYLRILRFFRFHARYGKGEPDKEAFTACVQAATHIDSLSGERIQNEMLKLLAAPSAYSMLNQMQENHILEHVLGSKIETTDVVERLERQVPDASPILKLAALATDAAACETMARRLKLSNALSEQLKSLVIAQPDIHPQLTSGEQKKLLRRLGAPLFTQIVQLSAARLRSFSSAQAMLDLAQNWPIPFFPLRGEDLIAIGMAPGKAMGEVLKRLENEWEAGDYTLTREQLLAKAKD